MCIHKHTQHGSAAPPALCLQNLPPAAASMSCESIKRESAEKHTSVDRDKTELNIRGSEWAILVLGHFFFSFTLMQEIH